MENKKKKKNMEETVVKNNELIENKEKEIGGHDDIVKNLQEQIESAKNAIKEGEENIKQNDERNIVVDSSVYFDKSYNILRHNKSCSIKYT